jgi:helicase MOV-10
MPMLFHAVEGKDERESSSPSWFNADEAALVLSYVNLLVRDTRRNPVQPRDIGVISPYNKQVQKIRTLLHAQGDARYRDIKVASTELFQGQERRVIIMSCVRSSHEYVDADARHNLGFLANPKRFNVAITRAQALLIVIGNPHVLCSGAGADGEGMAEKKKKNQNHWRELVRYCQDHGSYTGSPFSFRSEAAAHAHPAAVHPTIEDQVASMTKLDINDDEEPGSDHMDDGGWVFVDE